MSSAKSLRIVQRGFRVSDIALVITVTAIVGLMVMPIPLLLLDALIAVNILVSLTLLMMAAYVPSALALSTFPTLLMFTTLFRLSLNIASTKNILLHADAGIGRAAAHRGLDLLAQGQLATLGVLIDRTCNDVRHQNS